METSIDVKGLTDEQVEAIKKLVALFRKPDAKKETGGFRKSAGSWKGLIDAEELKRTVYSDRLVSTRLEAKL